MKPYRTKASVIPGTDYREVHSRARQIYDREKKRTRRRAYVRSAYFNKEKVFIDLFWQHLHQKNWRDRVRRLKYYPVALELIRHSKNDPHIRRNPNKTSEILYRFQGITADGKQFTVQIKENMKRRQKFLISIYPQ